MGFALNAVRRERGEPPLAAEVIRPRVSGGAPRLLELGFGVRRDDPAFAALHRSFLAHYEANLARETRVFPGMDEVLRGIEALALPWGVVTNKPGWLTLPLLAALGLDRRAACVVSGDTTPQSKPHPLPLLHACELVGVVPRECAYVGDDARDMEAGRRAGMTTVAALFGYIPEQEDPADWGADHCVSSPAGLLEWLRR